MISGWKYYNHALIPTSEPHMECPPPKDKREFWKTEGLPILARWVTNWDCGYETNWWFVIKDTPFDITALKSKRRYEINKGKKNFEVKRINPLEYKNELLEVTVAAYSSWPEKYRPKVEENRFRKALENWKNDIIYAGFDIETGQLCAYSYLIEYQEHLEFSILRTRPESEKQGINAAMVVKIVEDYNDRLCDKFYINDGARSIRHETAFQDYLEKYFEFRKAYCDLNICYRFPFGIIVKILYLFRKRINPDGKLGSLITGVLKMEEIVRG